MPCFSDSSLSAESLWQCSRPARFVCTDLSRRGELFESGTVVRRNGIHVGPGSASFRSRLPLPWSDFYFPNFCFLFSSRSLSIQCSAFGVGCSMFPIFRICVLCVLGPFGIQLFAPRSALPAFPSVSIRVHPWLIPTCFSIGVY